MIIRSGFSVFWQLLCLGVLANGAESTKQRAPTQADVHYGEHERQVLDFWQASSTRPTPLVFQIHGGGWVKGDKRRMADLEKYLAAGISVISINYRYIQQAIADGIQPPVKWPLHDAARALQFARHRASEWNIDKTRIAATGGSAGGCAALWLAFHPDFANPHSPDPVAHESTRLVCAAVNIAQTSLDPLQMKAWTPNSRYGGHAFGFWPAPRHPGQRDSHFAEFLASRDKILPWILEYSPFEHATADDPPIYLWYRTPPAVGEKQKDPTHTANFGIKLQEKLRSVGVPCELVHPGAPNIAHLNASDYLIAKLGDQPDGAGKQRERPEAHEGVCAAEFAPENLFVPARMEP
jgi:acetyl esterase/lipase